MILPKPKTKVKNKRGGVRVVKTVTKGVNPEGKKYRTVQKSVSEPTMDGRLAVYTTKTRVKGDRKYVSGDIMDAKGNVSRLGNDSYKTGKSLQKGMIKEGRSRKNIRMEVKAKPQKVTTFTPYEKNYKMEVKDKSKKVTTRTPYEKNYKMKVRAKSKKIKTFEPYSN